MFNLPLVDIDPSSNNTIVGMVLTENEIKEKMKNKPMFKWINLYQHRFLPYRDQAVAHKIRYHFISEYGNHANIY